MKANLKARGFSREFLLDRESTREEQNKITFNLTFYPAIPNAKTILADFYFLFTPYVAHKALFTNVPAIGFKNYRSLKDHLVWTVLPRLMQKADPNRVEKK